MTPTRRRWASRSAYSATPMPATIENRPKPAQAASQGARPAQSGAAPAACARQGLERQQLSDNAGAKAQEGHGGRIRSQGRGLVAPRDRGWPKRLLLGERARKIAAYVAETVHDRCGPAGLRRDRLGRGPVCLGGLRAGPGAVAALRASAGSGRQGDDDGDFARDSRRRAQRRPGRPTRGNRLRDARGGLASRRSRDLALERTDHRQRAAASRLCDGAGQRPLL